MRNTTGRWLKTLAFLFVVWAGAALAQDEDLTRMGMSEAERTRLRALLDQPIPEDALNATKINLLKLKDAAAVRLGDQVKAEEVLRQWAALDPSDVGARWRLRNLLASTAKRQEAYEIGQQLIKEIKYPPAAVRIRTTLAMNYIDDSDLQSARRLLEESEQIIKSQWGSVPRAGIGPYRLVQAEMEFNRCKSFYLRRTGKWQESLQAARLAVQKGRELARYEGLVDEREKQFGRTDAIIAYGYLADIQVASGQYAQADSTLREAVQWGRELGLNDNHMARLYGSISAHRLATGMFEQSKTIADRLEEIMLAQGFQKGHTNWIYSQQLGITSLAGLGQWQEAMRRLDAFDQEVKKVGNQSNLARQTWLRATVYGQAGRLDASKRIFELTLKWHEENYGPSHYFTAFTRGMYAQTLYKLGEKDKARHEFELAFQNITSPDAITGDFAEDAYRRQLKKTIFQSYIELLSETAATNAQDAELIFQMADHLNSSSVQQALSDAAVRSSVNVPGLSDVVRQDQDAKNEISALMSYMTSQGIEGEPKRNPQVLAQMRNRLIELEKLRKSFKEQIQKSYPEYFALLQPKAPTTKDIAKQLKPDELFISAVSVSNRTYVWAIDAQGQVGFHRWELDHKGTEQLVARLRKTLDVAELGARAPAFDADAAYQIYKGVIAPQERMLEGKRHLIVATSGSLAKFPIAVLLRDPRKDKEIEKMAWLIKDVAISSVPTANGWMSLKRLGKVNLTEQPMIAWGDPVFNLKLAAADVQGGTRNVNKLRSTQSLGALDGPLQEFDSVYQQIPPLPETRDEVLQLAKILNGNAEQDLILGTKATRKSVLESNQSGLLRRKQVLVFATHGLLAGDLPNLNQPALAMAANPNPNDSPLLTLDDVLSLKLNADWVVLSACNTAGDDGRAEEALSGLARGFFFAGSRSLLVTHWSVESESAMLLTTQAFTAYKKDPTLRRSEAVRHAMLEVMKMGKFSHPTYWAPYALVGEGGR